MRFETEEIHLIYTAEIHYTLYIRNTFRKPKATKLASIENVGHEKKINSNHVSLSISLFFFHRCM